MRSGIGRNKTCKRSTLGTAHNRLLSGLSEFSTQIGSTVDIAYCELRR